MGCHCNGADGAWPGSRSSRCRLCGSPVGEKLAVVDAHVAEFGHVEPVVGLETVAVDHGIGLYARPDDGKRVFDPTFGMITAWTLRPA